MELFEVLNITDLATIEGGADEYAPEKGYR